MPGEMYGERFVDIFHMRQCALRVTVNGFIEFQHFNKESYFSYFREGESLL